MSEESLEFGAEASDRTGPVGQLTRIVLNPTNRVASHVVIVPDDVAHGASRSDRHRRSFLPTVAAEVLTRGVLGFLGRRPL
jgi:hypothetical protein